MLEYTEGLWIVQIQTSWYYCLVFNLVKIVKSYSVGYGLKSKEASKEVSEVHFIDILS